jgi:hypothetical protein
MAGQSICEMQYSIADAAYNENVFSTYSRIRSNMWAISTNPDGACISAHHKCVHMGYGAKTWQTFLHHICSGICISFGDR